LRSCKYPESMDLTPLAPFVRDKPWMEEEPTRSPKDSLIYANP
jgi:hypothetical protein